MAGMIAPGQGQDLSDTTAVPGGGEKKRKKRRPGFGTVLDGRGIDFGGKLPTRHNPHGKPTRSPARGASPVF